MPVKKDRDEVRRMLLTPSYHKPVSCSCSDDESSNGGRKNNSEEENKGKKDGNRRKSSLNFSSQDEGESSGGGSGNNSSGTGRKFLRTTLSSNDLRNNGNGGSGGKVIARKLSADDIHHHGSSSTIFRRFRRRKKQRSQSPEPPLQVECPKLLVNGECIENNVSESFCVLFLVFIPPDWANLSSFLYRCWHCHFSYLFPFRFYTENKIGWKKNFSLCCSSPKKRFFQGSFFSFSIYCSK